MLDLPSIRKKSVRGVMSYAIRTLALQAIGFVATILLGYYLSPEDFGIYFIVISVVGLFTFLSDIGLAAALVQKKDEPTLQELRTTFTVQQSLAFIIFALIVFLTPVWRTHSGLSKDGLELLYALGFSFVLVSLKTIPSILMERKLEFGKLVIPQIVENLVFYSLVVYLAATGYGVRSYTFAVLARSVVGVAAIYILQRWQIGFGFARSALAGLLRFGVKFQLNDFLARIKDDLFIVVLSRFVPAAQMGYVSWAKRWSMFPYQFSVNSIMAVTFPTFSRLQEHPHELKRAIEKSIYFITLVIFPVLVGLSVLAEPAIHVVPRYEKWMPALPSLYFFCLNIAFSAFTSPLTNTLNAIGKIDKTLKLMVMWTVMTWTITPLMILYFSFTGIAIASAVISLTSFIALRMLQKHVPISFVDQIWRQALAAVAMGLSVLAISQAVTPSVLNLLVLTAVGAGTYAVVVIMLGKKKVFIEVRSLLK